VAFRPVRAEERRGVAISSTAPQARQRLMFAAFETALADVLAEETGARPGAAEPFVAAVALVGVIRAAFEVSPSGPEPDRDEIDGAVVRVGDADAPSLEADPNVATKGRYDCDITLL
jgi:hypothetical protein